MKFIVFTILCLAAVSALPINTDSHHPYEIIVAKTNSNDLPGEEKYNIIEIIPFKDFSDNVNNSKVASTEETTTNNQVTQKLNEEENLNEDNYSEQQKEKFARILEEVKEAVPEQQQYNEQNPEPEDEKVPQNMKEKFEILLKAAKPEVQKYDEQNPEPASEKENNISINDQPEYQNFEPQYNQDVLTQVIDHTYNGPSHTKVIEIQPDSESLQQYNIHTPQIIEAANTAAKHSGIIIKPKYDVPEPPRFTTKISVPPLPISLSSIRSMILKWPSEVPSMFKIPRIVYLGHQ